MVVALLFESQYFCSAWGIYSPRHFHCFHPRTRQTLVKALFSVLFYLIPPAHAPNHSITCNLCHTCMKSLLVEPLLLLPSTQPIVLVLLSQLSPAHPPQFSDDSPRKNERMQTSRFLESKIQTNSYKRYSGVRKQESGICCGNFMQTTPTLSLCLLLVLIL